MTTTITGLVTNPDGSELYGVVALRPLEWHTDTGPDRLVSSASVSADVVAGVVDLSVDADGVTPWMLTVRTTDGLVRLDTKVVPPADGSVRIDQLPLAPDTPATLTPTPGGGVSADDLAALRAEFNAQLSVALSQLRMDWLVDFQDGLLDGLRTYDTGWINLTAFAAGSPTTITDQWQIALVRRVGDVVDIILGFTLGSGRSGVLGTLPDGFHPDAANSAIAPMFSPGNTARGDVEIDNAGRVEVFGEGATVGNPYRAVFHFHTNDEFPMTLNRQIGGVL